MSRSTGARPRSRLLAIAGLMFMVLATLAVPASAQVPPAGPGTIPGAWIVTLDEGESPDRVSNEHAREYGAQVDQLYHYALNGYAARMSDQAAARVAQDPRVASVERDQVVTAFAPPSKDVTTSVTPPLPTGIDRIDADRSPTAAILSDGGTVDVDVAVIDTGIDFKHPDLNVVASSGKNCASGRFVDGNGHGTHVAGTIGALDDGKGVVGVAPGARLHAVRVLNNAGSGSWSSIICGVEWVTANASTIEVANMSLGGGGTAGTSCASSPLRQAICNSVIAGVTYVVAAGNSAADAATFVPAAYPEVITVSALADFDGKAGGFGAATCRADVDDTFADFSNYGVDVDLIAPGVCIESTWKGGGYNTISGTSMASPHVAGAAALYRATRAATPEQVKAALQAAGNLVWDNADGHDGVQEPLLNVAGF